MNTLISYRPPRIAFTLLTVSIMFWYFSPAETLLFIPYKLVASICMVIGFAGLILAWLQFKKSKAVISPTAKTTNIIRTGLYRYTRNPMYLGMFLILLGASFYMGTIPSMLAPVVFFLIIDKVFIPYEEEKLLTSFGDLYSEYMTVTRRWL